MTLDTLPDDTFQQVIDAFCSNGDDLPPLLLRSEGPGVPFQGHAAADPPAAASCGRSEPCRSLADVQRPTHGPWLVKLLYQGVLTDAVVEQARQGRVRTIDSLSTQGAWCGPTWSRSCWARAARYSNWINIAHTVTAGSLQGT